MSEMQFTSAEDFLAKLRLGTKEVYEIKARGLIIPVRMLSIDERLDIRNRMIAENSRRGGDALNLATLVQKEVLRAATTIAGGTSMPARFFDLVTLDETIFIYNEYQRVCEEVNPSLEQLSPERFNALIELVKKNPDRETLSSLSIPELRTLAFQFITSIQEVASQA